MATKIKREEDDDILPEEILSSTAPPPPEEDGDILPEEILSSTAPPRPREEDDGDDTLPGEIAFSTTPPPPGPATASEISIDDLVPLKPEQELKSRYPPGCPVWYSLKCSSSSSSASNEHLSPLEACYGIVEAIFIDLLVMKRIYKVESNLIDNDKEGQHYFLLEEQLAFATNCHVKVKMMMDEDEPDNLGLDGVILCPHWSSSSNIHDQNVEGKISYAVRILLNRSGSRRVRVMFNVDPNLISYDPSPSPGGGGGASANISSQTNKKTRYSSTSVGGEQEGDKIHIQISNHSLTDISLENQTDGENHALSSTAQLQQRLTTTAPADFFPSQDHQEKKDDVKRFKSYISSILESDYPIAWIKDVTKEDMYREGGNVNRLYQRLIKGNGKFAFDSEMYNEASLREDLFSAKQRQDLAVKGNESAAVEAKKEEEAAAAEVKKKSEEEERAKLRNEVDLRDKWSMVGHNTTIHGLTSEKGKSLIHQLARRYPTTSDRSDNVQSDSLLNRRFNSASPSQQCSNAPKEAPYVKQHAMTALLYSALGDAVISGGDQRGAAEQLHGGPPRWHPRQQQTQMQQRGHPQPSQGYPTTIDRSDKVQSNGRCKRRFNSASPSQQHSYLSERASYLSPTALAKTSVGVAQPSQGYPPISDRSNIVQSDDQRKRRVNSASPSRQRNYLSERASHVKRNAPAALVKTSAGVALIAGGDQEGIAKQRWDPRRRLEDPQQQQMQQQQPRHTRHGKRIWSGESERKHKKEQAHVTGGGEGGKKHKREQAHAGGGGESVKKHNREQAHAGNQGSSFSSKHTRFSE